MRKPPLKVVSPRSDRAPNVIRCRPEQGVEDLLPLAAELAQDVPIASVRPAYIAYIASVQPPDHDLAPVLHGGYEGLCLAFP